MKKKNMMKRSFSLLFAFLLIVALPITAHAKESSVTYEGGAEEFVFLNGSEYSETDLFDNFKGVMPGDTLTQQVTVKNNYRGSDKVKIYMRAETHEDDGTFLSEETEKAIADAVGMKDFLHQLTMTVYNGDEVIYAANADELDGLENNVLLGTFYPGDEVTLTVELSVPIELDNRYANRIGEVDWVFLAEEINDPDPEPEKTDKPYTPEEPAEPEVTVQKVVVKQTVPVQPVLPAESAAAGTGASGASTGDSSAAGIWMALAVLALAAIAGMMVYKKKTK